MKILSKLLLGLFVGVFGFISFSNANQLYGYAKLKPKNTNIPSSSPTGTTFYTDLATVDLKGYVGPIKLFVQSSYNCSPGNIMVKNGNTYTRYQMSFISSENLCVSPEIFVDSSSFQFFYATTQNINNTYDVQIQILDLDSFNTSVVAYTSTIDASVSLTVVCPSCPNCPTCPVCPNIDSEYCINNNLCPVVPYFDKLFCMSEYGLIEPESCPGVGDCPTSGFSRLLINGVDQSESLLYNVNIPDFIKYDYINYSEQVSDLNIEGYNEDPDYIQGIINTQNYTPTKEDFQQVFSNLVPYMKIIIFVLFLVLVWKMIKKIFK